MAGYGIITGVDYTVTTVKLRGAAFLSLFRTVRPAARRYSRRRAPSESRAVHSDRSPVCAAAARPGHRCFDRKYPREFGWLATDAPAREAAGVLRERPTTMHIRLCSARPASPWDRGFSAPAVQAASHRICPRLARDHRLARPAPFPVAATRHGRGQAIL